MNEGTLRNDIIFKIFFHEKKEYLQLVLKEVLKIDVKVDDIKFGETEILTKYSKNKGSVLDIRVTLPDEEIVYIEMQNYIGKSYLKRMAYYNGKLLSGQPIVRGDDYDELKIVYAIFFVDDNVIFKKFYTKLTMCDKMDTGDYMYPLENHVINLRKVEEAKYSKKMVSLLKCLSMKNREDLKDMGKEDEVAKEISDAVDDIEASQAYQWIKFNEEKAELDKVYYQNYFKDLGFEEGIAEGKKDGLEQGIEQGIEQGVEETIKSMYQNKLSIEDIAKYTNKSIDEIKKILK